MVTELGAIKEGDDPKDYFIPFDGPRNMVVIGSILLIATIGGMTILKNKTIGAPAPRKKRALISKDRLTALTKRVRR